MIPPGSDRCEFCDQPSPKLVFDKVIEKMGDSFSTVLSAEEVSAAVREARELLPQIKRQAELMYREFEENSRYLLEQKIDEVVKEATGKIGERLMVLEEEITQLMLGVLNKVRLNAVNGFSVAVKSDASPSELNKVAVSSEEVWNSISMGVSPEIVAGFETSMSLRKIGDFLYRAGRYDDAVKWYSRTLLSIMFPPTGPEGEEGEPKHALGEFIPFGAVNFGVRDVDGDGKDELVYVPSREIGSLRVISSVINKGGIQWPLEIEGLTGEGVFLPLFGNFGEVDAVFVHWRDINLLDASFLDKNGETYQVVRDNEKFSSIGVYDVAIGDLDGDGVDEIVAFTYPTGVSIFKVYDKILREEARFFTPKPCGFDICDLDGDDSDEVVLIGANGAIFLIDYDFRFGVMGLKEKLSEVNKLSVTNGNLLNSTGKEVYISSERDGLLQLRYVDGKPIVVRIDNKSPLAFAIAKIGGNSRYLVTLNQLDGSYGLEFYALEEMLGVSSLSKKFDTPLYLPEVVKLEKPKGLCSGANFHSKSISTALDVDGDGVDELFFGLDRLFLGVDLKF